MTADTKGSNPLSSLLRCPLCRGELASEVEAMTCPRCARSYPVVDGIPVLIAEERSVFSLEDFTVRQETFFRSRSPFRAWVYSKLPY